MATEGASRDRRAHRNAVAMATALAVVLVSLGLVFVVSTGARTVAAGSEALERANSLAASVAAVRAANAQAVVFAIDAELGVANEGAVTIAFNEAQANLEQLDQRLTLAAGWLDPELETTLNALAATGTAVLDAVRTGDLARAEQTQYERFASQYATATALLSDMQSTHAAAVRAADNLAGRVEAISQLLVTLLIPFGAILAYRFIARREQRETRLSLEARLAAEQQLSLAKDEFIAGVSHELRTPLTSIYGFSEYLVEQGIIDPAEAMELIGLINHDSAELSRMIEDLLTAARLDSASITLDIEPVDLLEEFETVAVPLRRSGSDIVIRGSATWSLADRGAVRQIARNLLSNAIRHGGPRVDVSLTTGPEMVQCTVADDGDGVSSDLEQRLFERFVHDGREVLLSGSVGLGLAIARSLARSMGGEISYERTMGWTTFRLELLAVPEDEISPSSREPLDVLAPRGLTTIMTDTLQESGSTTGQTASSGIRLNDSGLVVFHV